MPTLSQHTDALLIAVLVAAAYLVLLRIVDLNEREPLWSLVLVFTLGAVAAGVLEVLTPSALLELSLWPGAAATEAARFAAVAVGVAALTTGSRLRGWSELNDLMDGVIYGAAAGLGFSTAQTFVRSFEAPDLLALPVSTFDTVWTTALSGLAGGLFGALAGAGFGAAIGARGVVSRMGWPLVGWAVAVLAHVGHDLLAHGDALGGGRAVARLWVALLVPLAVTAPVIVLALGRERRDIREELAGERQTGAVSEGELALLESWPRRQWGYIAALFEGGLPRSAGLMALHNRQVMLALVKRAASDETDARRRDRRSREIERLRASILEMKRVLASHAVPDEA